MYVTGTIMGGQNYSAGRIAISIAATRQKAGAAGVINASGILASAGNHCLRVVCAHRNRQMFWQGAVIVCRAVAHAIEAAALPVRVCNEISVARLA
jgi:hypothetical protein